MDIRNAIHTQDGLIDCEVNHPVHGWIPFTASPDDTTELAVAVWADLQSATVAPATIPPHAEQAAEAIASVNRVHAQFLRDLTGGATIEERDTWKTKEEAARALIADTATEGQAAMLTLEAAGDGTDPLVLAQIIIAKADAFAALIGKAAGLKAKAKAQIAAATAETVPIENVAPALSELLAQLATEAELAALEWSAAHG